VTEQPAEKRLTAGVTCQTVAIKSLFRVGIFRCGPQNVQPAMQHNLPALDALLFGKFRQNPHFAKPDQRLGSLRRRLDGATQLVEEMGLVMFAHKTASSSWMVISSAGASGVIGSATGQRSATSSARRASKITCSSLATFGSRKGELSGAALDTIKTLAFDLAAVVSSIEGRGEHPRFLIHDGPREGDMARVIYERFFLYAAELEAAFPSRDEANFQYLITTTTPPPKSMRQGSRWLLEPVLDSRKKDKRLLQEDF